MLSLSRGISLRVTAALAVDGPCYAQTPAHRLANSAIPSDLPLSYIGPIVPASQEDDTPVLTLTFEPSEAQR